MLELHEKITRKLDSLNRATEEFYFDKHDLDGNGAATKKTFIHSSLRLKPLLTCAANIRNDERVSDVFAKISQRQQHGTKLFDELKNLLTKEVSTITGHECEALTRLMGFEYYELAQDLAGVLLLDKQDPDSGFRPPHHRPLHTHRLRHRGTPRGPRPRRRRGVGRSQTLWISASQLT